MKIYDYGDNKIKDFRPNKGLLSKIENMVAESRRTMIKVWFH